MTFSTYRKNVGRLLVASCLCLSAFALIGCGSKEEPKTPGYYDGPLKKKDPGATPGGANAPTEPGARGKASTD